MYRLFLILTLLTLLTINAGRAEDTEETNVYRCAACGEIITKTAAVVDGKLYHPECFRCDYCGEVIESEYLRGTDGEYYHPTCLERLHRPICAYCGKMIGEETYTTYRGEAYHRECYINNIAPRCDICGKPLESSYITDYWGNHFHPRHSDEYPVCIACGRLVCTDDRVMLDEYCWLCHVCAAQIVSSPEHARRLVEEVRDELASIGIPVTNMRIRIELVQNTILAAGREPELHSYRLAHVSWKEGKAASGDETATIKVLHGLPEDLMRGVIAHELMHVWQHENNVSGITPELLEGSANWASSLIFSRMKSKRGRFFLNGLNKSKNPVYGDGYREVFRYAEENGIQQSLNMLRNEARKAKKDR